MLAATTVVVSARTCGCAAACAGPPGQQRLVQPLDRLLAHAAGELDQRGRMRHLTTQGDAAEPLPADRVGDLTAQQLIAQPVAELQEHQPQVGVDRDRRTTDDRVEVDPEGLDEHRVVQQPVDLGQLGRQSERLGGQDRLPCDRWELVVRSTPPPIRQPQGIERSLSPFDHPSNSSKPPEHNGQAPPSRRLLQGEVIRHGPVDRLHRVRRDYDPQQR